MQTWIIYWLDMNSVQLMQQMDLQELLVKWVCVWLLLALVQLIL